jgi:hypothetical protein
MGASPGRRAVGSFREYAQDYPAGNGHARPVPLPLLLASPL